MAGVSGPGYYGGGARPSAITKIHTILYRDNPIIMGDPPLIVEGSQVLPRAPASTDDADIHSLDPVHGSDGPNQGPGGFFALDLGRHNDESDHRPPPPGHVQDVLERSSILTCDHGQPSGKSGQGPLPGRVQKPILFQCRPDPLFGKLLEPHPGSG